MNYSNMTREEFEAKWPDDVPAWWMDQFREGPDYGFIAPRIRYGESRNEALAEWEAANQEQPFWTEDPNKPGRLIHERWSWNDSSGKIKQVAEWKSAVNASACAGAVSFGSGPEITKSEAQAWIEARKKELAAEQEPFWRRAGTADRKVHGRYSWVGLDVFFHATEDAAIRGQEFIEECSPRLFHCTPEGARLAVEKHMAEQDKQETCPEGEKVDRPWDWEDGVKSATFYPDGSYRCDFIGFNAEQTEGFLNRLADRLDAMEKRVATHNADFCDDLDRVENAVDAMYKRIAALEAQRAPEILYGKRLERMVAAVMANSASWDGTVDDAVVLAKQQLKAIDAHLAKEGE